MLSGLNYSVGKVSEALPVLDFWPWRYATNYEFQPGPDCLFPLKRQDTQFRKCYVAVGDFPEVNVGPKWLFGTHAHRLRRRAGADSLIC